MAIPTLPYSENGHQELILDLGGAHSGWIAQDERIRIMHESIVAGVTFNDNAWEYDRRESKRRWGKALAQDGYGRQDESEPRQSGEKAADPTRRKGAERDWPIETRGVKITGENPMIVLYRPGSDDCVAIASMWTCTYSEAGQGRALVIWADPEATGLGTLAPVGIFADNPELARFIWNNFYNDYAPIHGRGIEEAPLRTARFAEHSGGRRLHRISCTSGTTTIELEWRDVVDVFHAVTYPTGYEVSVVAAPCAAGTITVNGKRAVGDIHRPEGWFKSSACLAFAETWVAVEEGSDDRDQTEG